MKYIKLYEQFINEGVSFGKKALKAKLEQKVEIAKKAAEKWGGSYFKTLERIEAYAKTGKLPSWKDHYGVQGGDKQSSYEIFMGMNAVSLAEQVAKIINKYKKHEVETTSRPAMAGWSGTARSTVGGSIEGVTNFNPGGGRTYLIAVTCGSGISSSVKDKMFQELYETFYILDEYNGWDGGVSFSVSEGSNYSTIGLTCSEYSFPKEYAQRLSAIMNDK